MKRTIILALVVVLILALAVTAVLATQPWLAPGREGTPAALALQTPEATGTPALFVPRTIEPTGQASAGNSGNAALTALLNYEIRDGQGQHIGTLDNLLLDLGADRLSYALMAFGSGVQSTNRLYPLPPEVLKLDPRQQALVFSADPKQLANAPSVERQDLAKGTKLPLPGDIRPFWGTGSTDTQAGARPGQSSAGTPTAGPPEAGATPAGGPQVLAAQLIGYEIYDRQTDQASSRLGTIQDLVVDWNDQRVPYVIMVAGDPLSPDKKLVPLPLTALQFDTGGKVFVLNVDPATVRDAPGFAQDRWPDLSQVDWDAPFRSFWQDKSGR